VNQVGIDATEYDAIFEGITHTNRRIAAISDDPPAAIGRTSDVHGVQREIVVLRRDDMRRGPKERWIGEHDFRRQVAAFEQSAGTVNVGQNLVEQLGPLGNTKAQRIPFIGRDE
jgi:hypothetical protein